MSDNFTHTPFQCGDRAALVSYLYDECGPEEREIIAAHLSGCLACAEEIGALGATRRMLPAWTPPAAPLGFQITGSDAPAAVVRPSVWWQRPLPAWAQAAAAAAIFAAGLAAGGAREAQVPAAAARPENVAAPVTATTRSEAPQPSANPASSDRLATETPAVSRDDLARLERDLRAELARIEQAQRAGSDLVRASSGRAGGPAPEGVATLERVEALIQESERRQRGELIEGMAQVLSDVENRQARYLVPIQRTVEGLSREAATNRSSVAALANVVSIQSGFRPVGGR